MPALPILGDVGWLSSATRRLVRLRPYQANDAPVVWAAIDEDQPALARWVPEIAARRTLSQVHDGLTQLIAAQQRGERLVFGIWDVTARWYFGEVGLYSLNTAQATAELGYWLRPSAQGQGRATEAVRLVVDYAAHVGLTGLEAHIAVENRASRRVADRTGFRAVGHRPAEPRLDGEASDVLIYARELDARPNSLKGAT